MSCPHCKGQDCTRIEIHLRADQTIQFHSCRNCEQKWWVSDEGGAIALDQFLSLAASTPKAAMKSA